MRIKRDHKAMSDFFYATASILWLETNITEQHVTEGQKEVEGGRIKNSEERRNVTEGHFPGVSWPRPPSVSPPRTPRPPRVWVAGKGGGRASTEAYSQPGLARRSLQRLSTVQQRRPAEVCSPAASFAERSPSWLSLSFCTQTRCRKSPSMSTSKGFCPILKVCGLLYSLASQRRHPPPKPLLSPVKPQ